MRGRKPDLNNVARFPVQEQEAVTERKHAEAVDTAKALRPYGMGHGANRIWERLAPEMVLLGRLKPHFADAFGEYCRITAKLAEWRKTLDEGEWTYGISGRNGNQIKFRPEVAQLNQDWLKWKSLVASFGMTPTDERSLAVAQGDLFDDSWGDV